MPLPPRRGRKMMVKAIATKRATARPMGRQTPPSGPKRPLGRQTPRTEIDNSTEGLQNKLDTAIATGASPKILSVLNQKLKASRAQDQQQYTAPPQRYEEAPQQYESAPQQYEEAPPQEEAPQQYEESSPQEQAPQEEEAPQEQPVPEEQVQIEEEVPPEEVSANMGRDVRIPLVSSHISNRKLRTTGLCITPNGCSVIHCYSKLPFSPHGVRFGVEGTINKHFQVICSKGAVAKQKQKAGEIVERARQGDQNAMAIISLVRRNAQGGKPRAQQAFAFMKDYISANPVKAPGVFGYTPEGTEWVGDRVYTPSEFAGWSSTMLANGEKLTNGKVANVVRAIGPTPENIELFMEGMKKWREEHEREHVALNVRLTELEKQILMLGKMLGRARAIQAVRMPNSSIAKFDKRVAWELGE